MITVPAPLAEAIELDRFSKLYFAAKGEDFIVSNIEYEGMSPCRVVIRGKRYYIDLPEKRERWVVLEVWAGNFILLYTNKSFELSYLKNKINVLKSAVDLAKKTYESTGKRMYLMIYMRCLDELEKLEKIKEVEDEGE